MSCKICEKGVIGQVYNFEKRGPCIRCKTIILNVRMGSYLGMKDGKHVFRVLPSTECPTCGLPIKYACLNCEKGDLDNEVFNVTEEFEQIKKFHPIGK